MSLRRVVLRSIPLFSPLLAGGCNLIFGVTTGTRAGSGGATSTSVGSGGATSTSAGSGGATSTSAGTGGATSTSAGTGGALCAADRTPPCNADGGACTAQLIDTEASAVDVAITGDYLFVTTDANDVVRRLRYDGSEPLAIFSTNATTRLAIQGNYVYWTDYYTDIISRSALDGSDVTALTATPDAMPPNQLGPYWIATDTAGAMVYWTSYAPAGISRIAAGSSGQSPAVVLQHDPAQGVDIPSGVALDETYLYWGDSDGVHRMLIADIGTSSPTLEGFAIDTDARAEQVILSADRVYWYTAVGEVRSKAKTDPPGVAPLIHWSGSSDPPTGLALDASFVYWLTASGAVEKAGLTDAVMVPVAFGPPQGDNSLGTLTVDCGAVYWAIGSSSTEMGRVFRAAKGP